MTFREWLEEYFYPGFDPDGLTDDQYYELEEIYEEEILKWVDSAPIATY